MTRIENDAKEIILKFARAISIKTFGRIDMRFKSFGEKLSPEVIYDTLTANDLYFIEINSMPTIEKEDSFEYAINAISSDSQHSLYRYISAYYETFSDPSVNGILLASAILSFTTKC